MNRCHQRSFPRFTKNSCLFGNFRVKSLIKNPCEHFLNIDRFVLWQIRNFRLKNEKRERLVFIELKNQPCLFDSQSSATPINRKSFLKNANQVCTTTCPRKSNFPRSIIFQNDFLIPFPNIFFLTRKLHPFYRIIKKRSRRTTFPGL